MAAQTKSESSHGNVQRACMNCRFWDGPYWFDADWEGTADVFETPYKPASRDQAEAGDAMGFCHGVPSQPVSGFLGLTSRQVQPRMQSLESCGLFEPACNMDTETDAAPEPTDVEASQPDTSSGPGARPTAVGRVYAVQMIGAGVMMALFIAFALAGYPESAPYFLTACIFWTVTMQVIGIHFENKTTATSDSTAQGS